MSQGVLLIGCGNLGKLLLQIWTKKKYKINVLENNQDVLCDLQDIYSESILFNRISDIKFSDYKYIILCVKPNSAYKLIKSISSLISNKQYIFSLIAGLKLDKLEFLFKNNNKIFRVMPNIFASVVSSSTAIFSNKNINISERKKINSLFNCLGELLWLKKENDMNFFTALYGGGPAYFFFYIKTLIEISKSYGLEECDSKKLVLNLLKGTYKFLEKNKNDDIDKHIRKVTSKGGTTEEAIKFFEENTNFYSLMKRAVKKAEKKSFTLSK